MGGSQGDGRPGSGDAHHAAGHPGAADRHCGQIVLRDLTADDVSKSLIKIAATRSARTVRETRPALMRAVTQAKARRKTGKLPTDQSLSGGMGSVR